MASDHSGAVFSGHNMTIANIKLIVALIACTRAYQSILSMERGGRHEFLTLAAELLSIDCCWKWESQSSIIQFLKGYLHPVDDLTLSAFSG